jgi:hypothetical protein
MQLTRIRRPSDSEEDKHGNQESGKEEIVGKKIIRKEVRAPEVLSRGGQER